MKTIGREPIVIALCGLPARGKSYLARKLAIYLRWIGINVKVFNAGDYRRKFEGAGQPAEYYDFSNNDARREREKIAKLCFMDLISWVEDSGDVAIFDATNTTKYRRKKILKWCGKTRFLTPIFLESICTDSELLERNYRLKLHNADYKDIDRNTALADFKKRVAMYESIYEPVGDTLSEEDTSYIKVYNVGRKVTINNCCGWLQSQVVSILQNFHISPRRIILTRHGESEDCVDEVLGRDSVLTNQGREYARKLLNFMRSLQSCTFDSDYEDNISRETDAESINEQDRQMDTAMFKNRPFLAYSSVLKRATGTVEPLTKFSRRNIVYTTALNELNAGLMEGLKRSELAEKFPEEMEERRRTKTSYRYPGGESYMDVVQRLQPIVLDLERAKEDILIVSHTAPIRALLAYFMGKTMQEMVNFDIKGQTAYEIRPCAFDSILIEHDLSKSQTFTS